MANISGMPFAPLTGTAQKRAPLPQSLALQRGFAMAAGIIETLLSVGKALFGLRDSLSGARKARKEKVAEFLGGIALTIETTSGALKQGIYPHGTCQELLSHSDHLVKAIGDLIGEKEATDLAGQLKEVWEIEQLYGQLQSATAPQKIRRLETLDQAAGLFRATAAFVRVSP